MAHFIFADDGFPFTGHSLRDGPLGGAESAFVQMAEALATQGHRVTVYNNTPLAVDAFGVAWRNRASPWAQDGDVYVANRSAYLLDKLPAIRRRIFWIHNPANYLLKWRYAWRLAWHRPCIVFSGEYHAGTYPSWGPPWGGKTTRAIVPYGIGEIFLKSPPHELAPPPKVIFTSNPMRGLDWLLKLWTESIRPQVPNAELHVFSGVSTYQAGGTALGQKMSQVLTRAQELSRQGVVLRQPVAKSALIQELRSARAMLYQGDVGETFCLALGEAQAMGVPVVVQPIGNVAERVVDGITGYVADDDKSFVEKSVRVLKDDAQWLDMHRAALARQGVWDWPKAARAFADLALSH
jgi:glycosyltransferase involved in cell wall biosynthesis